MGYAALALCAISSALCVAHNHVVAARFHILYVLIKTAHML